jgi:hypothetical protein
MKTTMVQSSIRKEIHGVIQHVDQFAGYLKIESADGKRYSVAKNRINNAVHGHRCIAEKGDAITFLVNSEDAVTEVRFVAPPSIETNGEETSVVTDIVGDLVFGKRVQPNCGCPVLLALHHKIPELEVGMIVSHTLGMHNNKTMAQNIKIDWNAYGENK